MMPPADWILRIVDPCQLAIQIPWHHVRGMSASLASLCMNACANKQWRATWCLQCASLILWMDRLGKRPRTFPVRDETLCGSRDQESKMSRPRPRGLCPTVECVSLFSRFAKDVQLSTKFVNFSDSPLCISFLVRTNRPLQSALWVRSRIYSG